MNLGQVGAQLNASRVHQMELMVMQSQHSKDMAGIHAAQKAADKIRA